MLETAFSTLPFFFTWKDNLKHPFKKEDVRNQMMKMIMPKMMMFAFASSSQLPAREGKGWWRETQASKGSLPLSCCVNIFPSSSNCILHLTITAKTLRNNRVE